ncbi:MAG: ABC transporter permease, partial [Oscillospiraceae bacterium]|nr:ABC transporter permease [Oscillospiraceae bacterium]
MKLTSTLALRHLKGNRKQAAFTITAAGIATAMLVGVSGIAYSFYHAFYVYAEAAGKADSASMEQIIAIIYSVGIFLSAIIVIGAVIVISNAFSISANEQVRQFGILKSVGATKKQIRRTVMSEGRLLSVIAIPAGIIIGYIVTVIGVQILNSFLSGSESGADSPLAFRVVFSAVFDIPTLIASAALAFATIMMSAYRVARKVSRLSAIDAIRQSGEVVVKPGKMKTSALTQKLFGFEGTLAAKSLKRAKRKYRATVVSLVTSIVLALVSAGFGQMLYSSAESIVPEIEGNVRVSIYNDSYDGVEQLLRAYPNGTVKMTVKTYDDYRVFYCQAENSY